MAENNNPPTPTEAILESISDGVFTIDLQWRITSFNRAAELITGVPRSEALGKPCADVFRSSMCGPDCALGKTLATGKPIIGRSGYIVNGDGDQLPISISTAVLRNSHGDVVGGAETFRDLSEVEALRRELEGKYHLGDLSSRSPLMRRMFTVLPAIAAGISTVLVLGETGTGKEMVARTIHTLSPRGQGPFVPVNCGALPDSLLESELFGYKAGAFTGALKDKPGRFAVAKGGTLFLDEIGEVSPALQVRLLRVLQDKTYEPLGGTKTENADVRVIAATNKNLYQEMKQGRFREDLYYRVNVVQVELPPLRDRKEDIPLLVNQFIIRFNRIQNKKVPGITAEALSLLMAHEWPGNIRELENVIERAFILCGENHIHIPHLPRFSGMEQRKSKTGLKTEIETEQIGDPNGVPIPEYFSAMNQAIQPSSGHPGSVPAYHGKEQAGLKALRNANEARVINEALKRNENNRQAAANELGIHKSTLFRKMKKLSITFPLQDGRSGRM